MSLLQHITSYPFQPDTYLLWKNLGVHSIVDSRQHQEAKERPRTSVQSVTVALYIYSLRKRPSTINSWTLKPNPLNFFRTVDLWLTSPSVHSSVVRFTKRIASQMDSETVPYCDRKGLRLFAPRYI